MGSILFDVGELHQHLFCIKKYRKDTLSWLSCGSYSKFTNLLFFISIQIGNVRLQANSLYVTCQLHQR